MAKKTSPAPAATSSHPVLIGVVVLAVIATAVWFVRGINGAPSAETKQASSIPSASPAPDTTTTSAAAATPVEPPLAPLPASTAAAAVKKPTKGPLPPLPMLGFAPPRPIDVVQAVFEFAARRPDVLEYVPCFCGCERSGHVGNDDCFVKSRDAEGNVEWEPHGMS